MHQRAPAVFLWNDIVGGSSPDTTTRRFIFMKRGKKYPERIFTLIIGADNWLSFNRWKDYDKIIEEYPIYIYPRRGYDIDERSLPANVKLCHAPIIEISSTQIRQGISEGKNMNYFIPRPVYDYIINHGLYKNKD